MFNCKNYMKKQMKKSKMPRAKMCLVLGCYKPAGMFSRVPRSNVVASPNSPHPPLSPLY